MVLFEYSLLFVFRLTALFVPAVFTLDMVVAEELLFETDLPSGPSPISCRAHQIVPFLTASTTWGLVDLITLVWVETVPRSRTLFSCLPSTVCLVFFFLTMNNSIALVLVLDAHLQVRPPGPVSRLAQ